ncbi:MAG TPA: hypothetical protein DCZ41_03010 [Firmicutes bacterium]|nr:hypothetical protein [Bacillota bacterium]
MKKMKKSLLFLGSLFLLAPLTSCSSAFFGGEDSGTGIANITTRQDSESGNTVVTITFTDEEKDPVVFFIPQGLSGKDGVSIKSIVPTLSEDQKKIILTITYSDDSMEPTVIEVPVLEGKGVKDVTIGNDEEGNTTLVFSYTDGSESKTITIPKGKDGNGIASFEVSRPNAKGVMTITVTFTDGTNTTFEVKNGAGIASVSYDESHSDTSRYALTITYTDGFTETVYLPRPKSTKWITGTTNLESDSVVSGAEVGDFYLNRVTGYVYQLQSDGTWLFLFGMKSEETSHVKQYAALTFNAGEGLINGSTPLAIVNAVIGEAVPLAAIPTPTYEGHVFEGWFTDTNNINAGKFTDLTIVTGDLTLFAKYSA